MGELVVVGFYGYSNSGKTLLVTELARRFSTAGRRVATMKLSEEPLSLDTPGKDTDLHRRAGASPVVFSTSLETDFLLGTAKPYDDVVSMLRKGVFGPLDLLLVEGSHDDRTPKVRVGDCPMRPNTVLTYSGGDIDSIERTVQAYLDSAPASPCLSIWVNGKRIPLTPFPASIISSTLVGMLSSLKEVETVETVELVMDQKGALPDEL